MNVWTTARSATLVATLAIPVALSACDSESKSPPAAGAASATASVAKPTSSVAVVNGLPVPDAIIRQGVNPKRDQPYSGPTGTIRGRVTIRGDEPPPASKPTEKIPPACDTSAIEQAKLFEVGAEGALADALVTITGYDAYIPVDSEVVTVTAKGCQWGQRTIAVTFGQRLEIVSKDGQPYVPRLLGGKEKAMLVAIPGGDAIKLSPVQPGRYLLSDSIKSFMQAEVLVLKYATHDVTGKDGRYEISGIPAGQEVTLTAFLPAIVKSSAKKLTVGAGETKEVDLMLEYKRPAEKKADASDKPMPH